MKLSIDSALCVGHGRCYSLRPDLFTADDEGYGIVKVEQVEGGQLEEARAAVAECPEVAIALSE
jgi:ferredoxin